MRRGGERNRKRRREAEMVEKEMKTEMEKKEVKTVEKLTGKELFEKNGKTILENEDESWSGMEM